MRRLPAFWIAFCLIVLCGTSAHAFQVVEGRLPDKATPEFRYREVFIPAGLEQYLLENVLSRECGPGFSGAVIHQVEAESRSYPAVDGYRVKFECFSLGRW